MEGQDRFRMELDTARRIETMGQCHDLPLLRSGRDLDLLRESAFENDQGMISCRLERAWNSRKEIGAIMQDRRSLAVHEARGSHDRSPEDLPDRLMAQTHSQDGDFRSQLPDDIRADPRIRRRSWTGRKDDSLEVRDIDFGETDPIVPKDLHLDSEFPEILDEVVCEGIVVVDHQKSHDPSLPWVISKARTIAWALARIS